MNGQVVCHDAYSCAELDISSSANIECYGQSSCINSVQITIDETAFVYCYGSFACYNSTLIQQIGEHEIAVYRAIYCMLIICLEFF